MRPEDVGFATHRPGAGQAQRPGGAGRPRQARWATRSPPSSSRPSSSSSRSLADKKKQIYDADLAALIEQEIRTAPELWSLVSYQVTSGTGKVPSVKLRLRRGGEDFSMEIAGGDGPIDAVFLAIE